MVINLSIMIVSSKEIPIISYSEILMMSNNESLKEEYLKYPMIIRDSPMTQWTIFENLDNIFPDDYEMNGNVQEANCDCFGNTSESQILCHQYVSTFLYSNHDEDSYDFWQTYQYKYNQNYQHCIKQKSKTYLVKDLSETFNKLIMNKNDNDNNKECDISSSSLSSNNIYNKSYTYFPILSINSDPTEIDSVQLTALDHIKLHPFYDIFDIENGFESIDHIHLWFGNNKYRAIRHFDRSHNLFFMLSGQRRFRLSSPTFNIYPLHPFNHKSSRQQFPYYMTQKNKEGMIIKNYINIEYEIWESDLKKNELLYLPSGWFHEIINQYPSCALSIWFSSGDIDFIRDDIFETRLPINPNKFIKIKELNQFFYFIQKLIHQFCAINNDDILMRCNDFNGYGYLLYNFKYLYPILNKLNYDTFEWMNIVLNIENIFKCVFTKIEYQSLNEFKHYLNHCYLIDDENIYKTWNEVVEFFMEMINAISDIDNKIAEGTVIELIEDLIIKIFDDTTIIPIIIKLMLL